MPADLLVLLVKQLKTDTKDLDDAMANLKKTRLAKKSWFDKKKRLLPETALISKVNMVLI